jgi:hypothetical protein
VPELVNVTVLVPGVNVPPLCDQLPDTLNVPDGAVSVPEDNVSVVVVTPPVDPVNVPPLIVNPPLNVCVALDAAYVPPDTAAAPVTVLVCPLALYVPLVTVKVPFTVTAPVAFHVPPTPLKVTLL